MGTILYSFASFIIFAFALALQLGPSLQIFLNCHLEYPSSGGTWKNDPPYWKLPGCPVQSFGVDATKKCLAGRTIYAMGNSVGRQAAFGIVQMLGGERVMRENQRDLCPKHETTWGDSCHQEFAGVKVKFLFLQYIDGFNYSSRGGFPFFRYKENGKYKTGRIPGHDTPNSFGIYLWPDDNCINHDTRSCLARFFNGSTENDVVIFNVGMSYPVEPKEMTMASEVAGGTPSVYLDTRQWLTTSLVNFRSHIEAVFRGHVFFQTPSQWNKYVNLHLSKVKSSAVTAQIWEVNQVVAEIWQLASQSRNWHIIDQWAINEGRENYYNDHVHFNGKLELAMLHQVLNILCPGRGDPGNSGDIWPNATFSNHLVCIVNNTECYLGDSEGYLQHLDSIPFYLSNLNTIFLSDNSSVTVKSSLPTLKNGMIVKAYTDKIVYLITNNTKRAFPNSKVFAKYGYDFGQLTYASHELMSFIETGPNMV